MKDINTEKRDKLKKAGIGLLGVAAIASLPSVMADPKLFRDDGTDSFLIDNAGNRSFVDLSIDTLTTGSVLFTGANGLIAQDNASLFWDDTNDRLGIGTASPLHSLDVGEASSLHAAGSMAAFSSDGGTEFSVLSSISSAGSRVGVSLIKSRGTVGSPTAVVDGDKIGFIGLKGYDGSAVQLPALIEGQVDDTVSSGVVPTRLVFITGSNGATRAERMTIRSSGFIGIGTAYPAHLLDIGAASSLHAVGARLAISNDAGTELSIVGASTNASGARPAISFIRTQGTVASPTAVSSGSQLGFFGFKGYDGSSAPLAGLIEGKVDDTVSSGVVPTQLEFITGSTGGNRAARLTVRSTGLIGIGNTAPGAMIDIIPNGTGVIGQIIKGSVSQTADLLQITDSSSTALFTVDSAGKVGIGNIDPVWNLDIKGSGEVIQRVWSTDNSSKLRYVSADGFPSKVQFTDTNQWLAEISAVESDGMSFNLVGDSNGYTDTNSEAGLEAAPKMFISKDGYFGIGTGAPTVLMDVSVPTGNATFRLKSNTLHSFIRPEAGLADKYCGVEYMDKDGVGAVFTGFLGTTGEFRFNNVFAGGYIEFMIGGVASLRAANNGYIGINQATPGAQLHVDTSGTGVIGQIIKATASQTADLLQIIDSSSNPFLTVDSSGNVGIGVATASTELEVSGTISGTTFTGANVTTGADPGHTHTQASLSQVDISDDTNLAVTSPVTLTDDTIGIGDVETLTTSLAGGSVVFSDGSNLAEDNTNLFWDDTNDRLGIGTATPTVALEVSGAAIISNLDANKPVWTNGSKQLVTGDAGVDVPICFSTYDASPGRSMETKLHGGMIAHNTAAALDSGTPISSATGIGKIMVVVNAGSDLAGTITLSGATIDRNTGVKTSGDTDTITVDSLTTDNSTTDSNSNIVHGFVGGYLTNKWFTGTVDITTTDLTLTDVDVWGVAFEQVNDQPSLTVDTFDITLTPTNVNADFDGYLYALTKETGNKATITEVAGLHIGAGGEAVVANEHYRLRKGNIGKVLDGTTDGIWADLHYNATANIEDVNTKIWVTNHTTTTTGGNILLSDSGDNVLLSSGFTILHSH